MHFGGELFLRKTNLFSNKYFVVLFLSHIRLTSLHNKTILYSFIKEIGGYCIDLRLDNLNWMIVADLRRLLSNFRSVVYFHSGNVSLSKSTIINDILLFFPYLKSLHLLITHDYEIFPDLCLVLNQIKQLESLGLILEDKKSINKKKNEMKLN